MSIFERLFKVGQAEAHAAMDKLEDPVKMLDQYVRDLKRELAESVNLLAEEKGLTKVTVENYETKKRLVADWEAKATVLVEKATRGELIEAEADRLATEALARRDGILQNEIPSLERDAQAQQERVKQLEERIEEFRREIQKSESEIVTLKSRAKTAAAGEKISKKLAGLDSSGTLSRIAEMRRRVQEQEARAEAYIEIAGKSTSLESEIQKALGPSTATSSSNSLAALKAKLKTKAGATPTS